MNDTTKLRQRIIWTTITCLSFLLITFFYHHIDKHLTGIVFIILTLLVPITFISIFVLWIKGLIQIIKNRKQFTLIFCLPTIITTATILFMFLGKYDTSEQFESEVEFRACYEGTQNQAYIKFRKDKTFELNWTGVFFSNTWWTGRWNKKGNILTLKYDDETLDVLGDSLLIENGNLNPLKPLADTSRHSRPLFYLGFCRGEN
jgi:hypothetical protein